MKTLTALILLALLSCKQQTTTGATKIIGDTKTPGDTSPVPAKTSSGRGMIDTFDQRSNNTYQRYIDQRLKSYLDTASGGWALPAPNRWDTVWFNLYHEDSSLVNYVSGDFDCNGIKDYALILKKANGTIGAYAFLSMGSTFKSEEIIEFGKDTGQQIDIGLDLLPPGTYHYIEPDSEKEPPPIKLKCNSIQVMYFERAAETYYWEKGKFKSITTGD
jgi:hypothetical protein